MGQETERSPCAHRQEADPSRTQAHVAGKAIAPAIVVVYAPRDPNAHASLLHHPRPHHQAPTFSQVARNEVWSGWKDDAFPTVDAAHQSAKRNGNNGHHPATAGAGGAKNKKKQQLLLVSNAGGRRY